MEAGAALMIDDEWLTPAAVTLALEEMLLDEERRGRMIAAARKISVLDGTARLVDLIVEAAR